MRHINIINMIFQNSGYKNILYELRRNKFIFRNLSMISVITDLLIFIILLILIINTKYYNNSNNNNNNNSRTR